MTLVETEQVLVVPTAEFHKLGHFQGFSGDVDRYLPGLLASEKLSYRPRGEMEEDPNFKQLIPYVVFRFAGEGTDQVFQYRRGGGQGESRLRSKRSVGVGGHISTVDVQSATTTGGEAYEQGMARELAEEVTVNTPYSGRCVGLINDDDTPVGRVHLGVVHLLDVESPSVDPRESDIQEGGFLPVAEIAPDLDDFETWSQIVVRALFC